MTTLLIILAVYYGVLVLAMLATLGFGIYLHVKEIKQQKFINQLKVTQIELTLEDAKKVMELLDKMTEEQIKKEFEEFSETEKEVFTKILEEALKTVKDESK